MAEQQLRQKALSQWVCEQLNHHYLELLPIVGDASFRRYFRVYHGDNSFIVMDAPPELEDCHSFVAIVQTFAELGLRVPRVFSYDLTQGFLLLSDFGERLYYHELNSQNATRLYAAAWGELLKIQKCRGISGWSLAYFDEQFMLRELMAFRDWFLQRYCQLDINRATEKVLQDTFDTLMQEAVNQPQVCVHRDYHSRNLMLLDDGAVGILDFQDAVIGPVTYDIVSLLRDCYIDWPVSCVERWLDTFRQQSLDAGILTSVSQQQYTRWFDLMGMQRHLKAIFIFARKYLRDDDASYLPDIQRALNYIQYVADKHSEFRQFSSYLKDVIVDAHHQVRDAI